MSPDVFQSKLRKPDQRRTWLVVLVLLFFVSGWALPSESRSSRRSASGHSRHSVSHASTSRSSSRRRGGRSSAHSLRGSRGHVASRHGHRTAGGAAVHHEHGPTAAQIRKQETSGNNDLEKRTDLERSYRAYDQGLTDWLAGNYSQAAKNLNDSYELYSDFNGSKDVLDSIYLYDLGQVAEAAGNLDLAKNSYQRSLRRRPDFSDCCIRLAGLLTKNGETALALVYARRLTDKNPQDPRAHFLLATMLERAGFAEESKTARENFRQVMKGGLFVKPQSQTESGDSGESTSSSGEQNVDQKSGEKSSTESGAVKSDSSPDSEKSEPSETDSKKTDQ